jgi:hypothetical protein
MNGRAIGLQRRGRPNEGWVGEHPVEAEPPDEPRAPGPEWLDLLSCRLHHPAERNVGGTHVLACPAYEAEVHEALEGPVRDRDPVLDGAHRSDPPAG